MYYERIGGREYVDGEKVIFLNSEDYMTLDGRIRNIYDSVPEFKISNDIDEFLYMDDMSEKKFLEERKKVWEEFKAKREERAKKAIEYLRRNKEEI